MNCLFAGTQVHRCLQVTQVNCLFAGNTSDCQEAVSEAASSHSVDENELDNFSDMMSANVSGRGSPSISGRDTPLSQAESVEENRGGAAELPVPVPETVQKQNRVDVTDRFGKFDLESEFFVLGAGQKLVAGSQRDVVWCNSDTSVYRTCRKLRCLQNGPTAAAAKRKRAYKQTNRAKKTWNKTTNKQSQKDLEQNNKQTEPKRPGTKQQTNRAKKTWNKTTNKQSQKDLEQNNKQTEPKRPGTKQQTNRAKKTWNKTTNKQSQKDLEQNSKQTEPKRPGTKQQLK